MTPSKLRAAGAQHFPAIGLVSSILLIPHAIECRASDQSRVRCSLQRLTACATTNDLVWSPGFDRAVEGFAAGLKAGYFGGQQRPLGEEALVGLGGPPQPRVALPGGRLLFSACPAHNCGGNGAALILDAQGHIEALGFSSFHCSPPCDIEHRYLDFYVRRDLAGQPLIEALTAWGRGSTLTSMTPNPVNERIDERTIVHYLPH